MTFDPPKSASIEALKEVNDELDVLMDLKDDEGLNIIEISFDILKNH